MNDKTQNALKRLNSILPLKQRQDACTEEARDLHRRILRSFVDRGRILSRQEMQHYVADPDQLLRLLQEKDMVVLSASGEPVGAYPFTMEPREHAVLVNGHRVHAMCALDALAVAPMFNIETEITSRCRLGGDPVRMHLSGKTLLNPEQAGDVHVGIAWGSAATASCCADSLCMEMIFLKDGETARQWLACDPDSREIFSLEQAVEFGDRFFSPLLA